jgi:hypothetical protein
MCFNTYSYYFILPIANCILIHGVFREKKVYSNLLRTPTIHEIEFISIKDIWCKDPLSTSNKCFKWNHKCILHAILYTQIFMWFQVIEIMLKSLHHIWLKALDSTSHARLVFVMWSWWIVETFEIFEYLGYVNINYIIFRDVKNFNKIINWNK